MSSAALKLLNEAKIMMRNCENFTPYQVPAPLWELTQPLIRDLASMIVAYGFPYNNRDNRHQRLYLKTRQDRVISLSISVPPAVTVLTVGDSSEECFFIIFKTNNTGFGLLIWNKKIPVSELFYAMLDLDEIMESRGFYNPKTKLRTTLFGCHRAFHVSDIFPEKYTTYELRATWDAEKTKQLFDEPQKLAIVAHGAKRLLCLASQAQDPNLGQKLQLRVNAPRTPQELLERVVQQHSSFGRS